MTTKEQYYILIHDLYISKYKTFNKIHDLWFECFSFILKDFKVGFNDKSIKSLFYDFEMNNWKAMHKKNSVEYKNHTKKELLEAFKNECSYISDRASYDRLFRTHWLFREAFHNELNKLRYPTLYKK